MSYRPQHIIESIQRFHQLQGSEGRLFYRVRRKEKSALEQKASLSWHTTVLGPLAVVNHFCGESTNTVYLSVEDKFLALWSSNNHTYLKLEMSYVDPLEKERLSRLDRLIHDRQREQDRSTRQWYGSKE